tara:strand:+ start:1918 stop:2760 length:843 start_codon:yes stop_codon:yes gene_type:complete
MNVTQWAQNHKITIGSVIFLSLFLTVYLSNSIFIYIYPGQTGILFRALADEPLPDTSYREGLYTVAPWNKMYILNTNQQKITIDVETLTSNGLHISVRVSAVFYPDTSQMRELVNHIGSDYADKILAPALFSSVRKIVGRYPPEALYTTSRLQLHEEVFEEVQRELDELPFTVKTIVIEKLALPKEIQRAIEKKIEYQQEALAYEYILKKEVGESERREIEAKSIKAYQDTVSKNLSPLTLKWLEIRAMQDLSTSKNSKVIVMGNGNAPIVLDALTDSEN